MIVRSLELANVRNIGALRIDLDDGVNLFVGPNGAGKTAVLEALHLLVRGRSFRGRAEHVISHKQSSLVVRAQCEDADRGTFRLGHVRERGGGVETRLDGQTVRQSSVVAALLPLQLLLPDLADLVFGGPSGRREWLDWGTFHVKHDHAANQRKYLRALRHRNVLLRTGDLRTLDEWTAELADLGEAIAVARAGYFADVVPEVRACARVLTPTLDVDLTYYPGWSESNLTEALAQQRDRDVKSGATSSGPHRADVAIAVGGVLAAGVLSRGQGKAVASALRLGQAQRLRKDGARSLFLIDDVGAELDQAHGERFYGILDKMECQIAATSAHAAAGELLTATRRGRMFHMKHGRTTQTNAIGIA